MTWGKVSDRLHAHSKARRAREAMALWVLALSWSCDELTDGAIPADMPELLIPGGDSYAEKLVSVGLWERTESGFRFHDWLEFQPPADNERERRESVSRLRSEAGRRGNIKRWGDRSQTIAKSSQTIAKSSQTDRNAIANGSQTDRKRIATPSQNDRPVPVPVPVPYTDSLRSSVVARAAHDTDSPPRSRGDGSTCGTDPLQSVAAAPAPAQWALRPSAQQEPPPKAEAPAKGRQRRPAQLVVDPVPPEGTAARRVYEAITTDAALAPIVRGPGDLSMRLVAICDGTSADPVAEVIAAGAWHARNLKWSDGTLGLLRWVKTSADRARAMPAVVGTPRAASEPARIDYQGKRVVGAAGLPSGDVWASDRDEESEAFARIRERTQPKGRGE